MIDYREFPPSPALASHVECYWAMSGRSARSAPIERVLPDGCVELVMHLADPFRVFSEDGRSRPQPRAFVVGPSVRFLLIQPGSHVATMGVRFRPAGARLLLPMPLHEIADRVSALEELVGHAARPLLDAIGNAPDDSSRVRILDTEFLGRLARVRPAPNAREVVRFALDGRGQRRVAAIGRQLGVSARQVERLALSELGLPLKTFSRLVRFQAVFDAVRRSISIDWATTALDCGYADQAHLIRDFKDFSGETPATLISSQGALSRCFTSLERLRAFFAAPNI